MLGLENMERGGYRIQVYLSSIQHTNVTPPQYVCGQFIGLDLFKVFATDFGVIFIKTKNRIRTTHYSMAFMPD